MSRRKKSWRVTRWARSFLSWSKAHPIAGAIALLGAVLIAMFAIAQGLEWVVTKVWPTLPRILGLNEESGAGGNFSVIIENPTDVALIVSKAELRAERPPTAINANDTELVIPAVTYNLPYDCSPGTKHVKLTPAFKIQAKDVGAVVFRSTVPMQPCRLFVSLDTSQGRTKEQEGVSLGKWRKRAP